MFGQTFESKEPCESTENYANTKPTGSIGILYKFALILSKPRSNNVFLPRKAAGIISPALMHSYLDILHTKSA